MTPEVVFSPDPSAVERSNLSGFARFWAERRGSSFADNVHLYRESVRDPKGFWSAFVESSGIQLEGDTGVVWEGAAVKDAQFFPNAKLSFATNLLTPQKPAFHTRRSSLEWVDPNEPAVISVDETRRVETLTRRELEDRVRRVARALKDCGISAGDRIFGLCRLTASTLVAHLATLAVGATWSSAAPDMGDRIVDRQSGSNRSSPFVCGRDLPVPRAGTQ